MANSTPKAPQDKTILLIICVQTSAVTKLGQVVQWPKRVPVPKEWLICNGQSVTSLQAQYPELVTILTSFGWKQLPQVGTTG